MNLAAAESLIRALALPASARVNLRVSKAALSTHGTFKAADKRVINDGIDDVYWVAALKPTTVGIAPYTSDTHEYLEIAVLQAALRPGSKVPRVLELIHRAIPYPVVLAAQQGATATLSLAHKRRSQSATDKVVVESVEVTEPLAPEAPDGVVKEFRASLALANQPAQNLFTVYGGWVDAVAALAAARVTGEFAQTATPERTDDRRKALVELQRLEAEISALRKKAAGQKQMSKRVELNLEVKRLEAACSDCRSRL